MKVPRFSLTSSILSSLACLLGLTWILLSLISFKTAEQDLLAQKNEEAHLLLASFIGILPDTFPDRGKEEAVEHFVAKLARERDFGGIAVVNGEGAPVYGFTDRKSVDERLLDTLRSGSESSAFSPNGLFVIRYAPIFASGRVVGASRLALSLAGEYDRLKRSRHIFFAYFILDFLLLLVFGSYLLGRIVVLPIKRLLTATERITAGDYNHLVKVPGSAEIAEVAESFTLMQEALRSKRDEVDLHVKSLERANTELQAAREETVRSEKMASVGLLAAGMAHEIGTPLSAIMGYAGIMQEELQGDPEKRDYLRRIEEEAGRIDRLIRGLLDYARPTKANYEQVEIRPLVEDTLALFTDREAFRKMEITLNMERELPPVYVDRHQLQQVLINLFLNARDALPEDGKLEISACRSNFSAGGHGSPAAVSANVVGRRKEDFNSAFSLYVKDEGEGFPCVRLDVRDSGTGISPDNLAKVFDPFFTTKEPGKGTGLGLAVCARIIDTFGGRITVASIPEKETTFSLWLPYKLRGGEE